MSTYKLAPIYYPESIRSMGADRSLEAKTFLSEKEAIDYASEVLRRGKYPQVRELVVYMAVKSVSVETPPIKVEDLR